MGVYLYTAKKSNPITLHVGSVPVKVYRWEFFCLSRDLDRVFDDDGRSARLNRTLDRMGQCWGDDTPKYVVWVNGKKPQDGDEVYRMKPGRWSAHDCYAFPGEKVGTIKKVGRSWQLEE